MPHLLIMSARGPRMRSELVDIKYMHIAIHGVLFVWRAHLARQTDIWSDGFWNFWTWRTASETCSCLVTYANILLRETDRENTLHNYKRSSNTGHWMSVTDEAIATASDHRKSRCELHCEMSTKLKVCGLAAVKQINWLKRWSSSLNKTRGVKALHVNLR